MQTPRTRYFSLILACLTLVFGSAHTDRKVDTFNAERLEASMIAMMQPLSQAKRRQLLTNFFYVAYHRSEYLPVRARWDIYYVGDFSNSPMKRDKAIEMMDDVVKNNVNAYLDMGRLDTDVKRVNGWGDVSGRSRTSSFRYFIDFAGVHVDRLSGHDIMKLGPSIQDHYAREVEALAIRKKNGTDSTTVINRDFNAKLKARQEQAVKENIAAQNMAKANQHQRFMEQSEQKLAEIDGLKADWTRAGARLSDPRMREKCDRALAYLDKKESQIMSRRANGKGPRGAMMLDKNRGRSCYSK